MADFRLTNTAKPILYDLSINLYDLHSLSRNYYQGILNLTVQLVQESLCFYLHAKNPLEISSIAVVQTPVSFQKFEYDLVQILLPSKLSGVIILTINFNVTIDENLEGCYQSFKSSEEYLISTYFEPNFARKAFPCFDEPKFRAPFRFQVIPPKPLHAISNAPIRQITEDGAYIFEDTLALPTYLFHWTLSSLDKIQTIGINDVPISLYVGQTSKSGRYLKAAAKCVEFYSTYLDEPYGLPKLDLLALYSNHYIDLLIGGMEQWGAITFKESYLMDSPSQNYENRQQNYRLVAHEISHMWFGDLVTLQWWQFLWLKEGIARFLEMKCLESFKPTYHFERDFFCDITIRAFITDVNNPRPIECPVDHPQTLQYIFDAIVYDKGASLIRMLQDFIGQDIIQQVFRAYLNRFKMGCTTSDDFFSVLEQFAPQIDMKFWFRQGSFPIVLVEKQNERRFRLIQNEISGQMNTLWPIPIKYCTDDLTVRSLILDQKECILKLDRPSDWVKLNVDSKGFYMVMYDDSTLAGIIKNIGNLSVLDKAGLLNTFYIQWATKMAGFPTLLRLLKALISETSRPIFFIINFVFMKLNQTRLCDFPEVIRLVYEICFPVWTTYGLDILDPNDKGSEFSARIAYWYLVVICRDKIVSQAIYDASRNNSLPQSLGDLIDYAMVNVQPQAAAEKARQDEQLASLIIKHCDDQSVIQNIILYYRDCTENGNRMLVQAIGQFKNNSRAIAVAILNIIIKLGCCNFSLIIEERLQLLSLGYRYEEVIQKCEECIKMLQSAQQDQMKLQKMVSSRQNQFKIGLSVENMKILTVIRDAENQRIYQKSFNLMYSYTNPTLTQNS